MSFRRTSMGIMAAAALATGLGPFGIAAQGLAPNPPVVPVEVRETRSSLKLGGTVVPYRQVTLSAQLPGRVRFLAGKEGDRFAENELLAALDDAELRAQERAALAAWRDADAQLRNAGVQYGRELTAPQQFSPGRFGGMGMPSMMDQFVSRPMGSVFGLGNPYVERQAELYRYGTQVEQARNQLARAQSEIQQIRAKLRDSRSIAPFNGAIIKKMIEEGDTVQPGQPLLEFADTEYLQIQVEVPARLMPGVKEGMVLEAQLDIRNTPIKVRVAQIFPMADPERHTVRVKFDVPPAAPAAPGMYAEVRIPDINAPVRTTLVIPEAAIIRRGSLPMVEVVRDGDKKELRIVRLGERIGAYHVSVLSGLQAGDFVVLQSEPAAGPGGDWPPPPQAARGAVY